MKTPMPLSAVVAVVFLGWSAPTLSDEAKGDGLFQTKVVPFADLNTVRPEGAKTLYHRIQRAARQVCDLRIGPQKPQQRRLQNTCYAEAVAHAVQHVNLPQLTASHDAAIARAAAYNLSAQ